MKNNLGSRTERLFKRIFKVRLRMDLDRLQSYFFNLVNGFKHFAVPQQIKSVESFERAKARLNLTDSELLIQQKGLLKLSIIMASASFLIFMYALYQLFYGSISGVILSIVVMSIALVLAFRYHFWYFQIKERKLGCTISEWFMRGFMGLNG